MIRRIIVPLDGTAFGEYAIPFAVAIASRAGATIELLHVCLPQLPPAPWLAVRARALQATSGLHVVARTVHGPPAETLCEEIAAQSTDLVVMSTHARGGLRRARMGSVGDMLVRHAAAPVLLVQPPDATAAPPPEPQFRRILIALDGSAFSEQVLAPARDLIDVSGVRPWLLRVVTPLPGTMRRDGSIDDRTIHHQRRDAEEYLSAIALTLTIDEQPVDTTVVIDRRPAAVIRDACAVPNVDVVALATHGRGGISRLLIGSTGDEVVRSVTTPVLLYRPCAGDAFDWYGQQSDRMMQTS